jgi:hypothetical protein
MDDGDIFRRKDLHDAVRADRKDIPSRAGRPGNGRAGVRTFGMLDPLFGPTELPAVRSQSIRLGKARVLCGRKVHPLAKYQSVLPAVAGDSALPAKRLLPVSAAVLSTVQRVMDRPARLWRRGLWGPGLRWSDGAARSLCRDADGSLPVTCTGGFGPIVTESRAVRPGFEPVCRLSDVHWFANALARVAAIYSDAATPAACATVLAGSLHCGTPFFPRLGRKKSRGGRSERLETAGSL